MMAEREGFAGRWSRLKAEARVAEQAALVDDPLPPPSEPAPTAGVAETGEPPVAAEPASEENPVDLPPIETLTKETDFSLFMRPGVDPGLRSQALRKLWTLDPHFATIDITECHSIDFNAVPTFPDGLLNTIYRVGSGMVEAVEEIERAAAAKTEQAADDAKTAESPSPASNTADKDA
jgi:hypothetical protein